ncbi:MAG: hypothetical protein COA92_09375 [Sulfurovum sp.]|nr:MAG: hypothetical protein COA92_09375 [Sulfurovum sp.]
MKLILSYKTSVGIFYIGRSDDNLYHPIFNEKDLGSYQDMWVAVKDLVCNDTQSVIHPETDELLDTSTLGIPEDYIEWDRV